MLPSCGDRHRASTVVRWRSTRVNEVVVWMRSNIRSTSGFINRPGSIYWCRLVSYFECIDRIHRVIVVSRVRATIRTLFVVHSWSRPVVNVRGPDQSTSERTCGLHLQVEDNVTGPEQRKLDFLGEISAVLVSFSRVS